MQTYARFFAPLTSRRTRWRFGLNRRFVATIECERLFPNPGFLPQTEQTLDTAGQCSDEIALAPGSVSGRAQAREQVGHLERGADRISGAVDSGLALLDRLDREHAERHRHARLDRRELQA